MRDKTGSVLYETDGKIGITSVDVNGSFVVDAFYWAFFQRYRDMEELVSLANPLLGSKSFNILSLI